MRTVGLVLALVLLLFFDLLVAGTFVFLLAYILDDDFGSTQWALLAVLFAVLAVAIWVTYRLAKNCTARLANHFIKPS